MPDWRGSPELVWSEQMLLTVSLNMSIIIIKIITIIILINNNNNNNYNTCVGNLMRGDSQFG